MTLPNDWGAPEWLLPASLLTLLGVTALVWSYARSSAPLWVRLTAAVFKAAALVLLAMLLLEPLRHDRQPTAGANLFVIMADASQSLQVKDRGQSRTRAQQVKQLLDSRANWQVRLDADYDVRRYAFDRRLRPQSDYDEFDAAGVGSTLYGSLAEIARRYHGRPNAGILLLTDGNATDLPAQLTDADRLPPVYPVVMGDDAAARDINIRDVSVGQTNFETAPVTVSAELACAGYEGKTVVVQLLDDQGKELERQTVTRVEDHKPFALRFQLKPEKRGVLFYQLRAFEASGEADFADPARTAEATLVNNQRLLVVDRGGGPFRLLYVCGRPNWELKFLRRAMDEDDELELVALVRIARREPRFSFRGHIGETTNPLFRGFGNQGDEQAEQYDEPVLLRLGTKDEYELSDGFPKSADELFAYDAIVLDDVEADFFSQDQKSLIQQFVGQRGGGLLMLGGQESFIKGNYDHTPIGELLPVYADRLEAPRVVSRYELDLTREGLLQPWVRMRSTEEQERTRLETMPRFKTVNQITSIKPGASVLAVARAEDGSQYPALVVQRFGKGRSAALLIGDLWRWQLGRTSDEDDLMKSWRQTLRWLVSDVPQRVEAQVHRQADPQVPLTIETRVRDASFRLLDNASVQVQVQTPDGARLDLVAEPIADQAGVYSVAFVPRDAGAYRAAVVATADDGSEVGRLETGWVSEPAVEEFQRLYPNRDALKQLAKQTGGDLIEPRELDRFVRQLPHRKIPITERRTRPWWHHWAIFLLAVGLLVGEWGLRRWKGLA